VLDLREIASFTDYFVIASGANERQVQAISDAVVENAEGGRYAGDARRRIQERGMDSVRTTAISSSTSLTKKRERFMTWNGSGENRNESSCPPGIFCRGDWFFEK
jgi:hypothetical protein